MSETQDINLAYIISVRNPINLQDLKAWNCYPVKYRACLNFKQHLC